MNRARTAAAALGAVTLASSLAVAAPAEAAGWPYSSTINVTGTSGCYVGGAQYLTAKLTLNGAHYEQGQTRNDGRYDITVPNIPGGTSYAWMQIVCAAPDGSVHQGWATIYRTYWNTITKNF